MQKTIIAAVMVLMTLPLWGQERERRSVGPFSGIKVAEGIDVYLTRGEKESVEVQVSGTDTENVITEVAGSYLKVHMAHGTRGHVEVKVYVTYVRLERLSASAAGNIFSDEPITGDEIDIQCSSAGNIEVAVRAKTVQVHASSAGQVDITGTSDVLEIEVGTAAQVDAYDLEADKVVVDASSAGSAKVHVKSDLVANAGSGGSVRYRGSPSKSVTNSNSGGSVKKSG